MSPVFSLLWPYVFVLAPLPFVVRFVLQSRQIRSGAITVPFFTTVSELSLQHPNSMGHKRLSSVLRACALWCLWLALLCAAARPVWIGDPISLPQEKRDLILSVDISPSMLEQDMLVNGEAVSRLHAVKNVVGDFIQRRSGDRLGLILFGQQAYLQTPLTHDLSTVKQQLQEAQAGFAGESTAIGDAIGLAIKRLKNRSAESRVLVLLTDGENTSGTNPTIASKVAKEAGIRIHTIGIGATTRVSRNIFGQRRERRAPKQIDERLMKKIAADTGGRYFYANNPDELGKIYQELDRLEPQSQAQTFRPTSSLSYIPALIALLLSVLLSFVARERQR